MWDDLWIDWLNAKNLDLTYLDELIDPDLDDELIIYDVSDDEIKKITIENAIGNVIPGFVITDDLFFIFTDNDGLVIEG